MDDLFPEVKSKPPPVRCDCHLADLGHHRDCATQLPRWTAKAGKRNCGWVHIRAPDGTKVARIPWKQAGQLGDDLDLASQQARVPEEHDRGMAPFYERLAAMPPPGPEDDEDDDEDSRDAELARLRAEVERYGEDVDRARVAFAAEWGKFEPLRKALGVGGEWTNEDAVALAVERLDVLRAELDDANARIAELESAPVLRVEFGAAVQELSEATWVHGDPRGGALDAVRLATERYRALEAEVERLKDYPAKTVEAARGALASLAESSDRAHGEVARLTAEVARLTGRIESLVELVSGSAPLTWVATGDLDGASAWERRALAAIQGEAAVAALAAPPLAVAD